MLKLLLKIIGGILALVVLIIGGAVIYILSTWNHDLTDHPVSMRNASMDSASVARGEYLFKYSLTCWMCHSDVTDPMRAHGDLSPAGGMTFDLTTVGPGFGYYYPRNITPDSATGIGAWTDGEIVRAIREGVDKNNKPLFLMPSVVYKGLSDDDVFSIVSYIRTLKPVHKVVPERKPSFAAKALFRFGLIKPQPPILEPIVGPERGPTPEYGKYLVQHAAVCNDCHTPMNMQTTEYYKDSLFAGGGFPIGELEGYPWTLFATNITPHKEFGIGHYTQEDFMRAVRSGMRPDSTVLSPVMPFGYYRHWTDDDLKAVYSYLVTIPAVGRRNIPITYKPRMTEGGPADRGKALFEMQCMFCHGENAMGATPTKVKLAQVAHSLTDAELALQIAVGNTNLGMPAYVKSLKPEQIGDLVAYIRSIEVKNAP